MTAVPLEALYASLFMSREEGAEAQHYLRWLWRIWLPMVALVMVNDLHGWMFRITAETDGAFRYSYGALYYFVFGWIGTFSIPEPRGAGSTGAGVGVCDQRLMLFEAFQGFGASTPRPVFFRFFSNMPDGTMRAGIVSAIII